MTPQENIILLSAKIHPSEAELQALNAQIELVHDWELVTRNLTERGMAPLFYSKLPKLSNRTLIPTVSYGHLKQVYYRTLTRGMMLYEVFRRVADALTLNGIRVVALKGVHLAEWLYQDIGLRQFSDIDLLVRKEDAEKCLKILRDMGFVQSGDEVSQLIMEKSDIIHYPAMVMNDISIEIHINLNRPGKAEHLDARKFIHCAEPLVINHSRVHVLELYDLLIFLCVHLEKHFQSGELQFTCFSDLTNLIDIRYDEIDWQKLEIRSKLSRVEKTVYKNLYLVHKYFHARMPEYVADQYSKYLPVHDEELFQDYLNGFRYPSLGFSTHMENIGRTMGIRQKLRYFALVAYPPRKFMVQSFRIKHPELFWLYYPARHWKGLRGMWKMVSFRAKTRKMMNDENKD